MIGVRHAKDNTVAYLQDTAMGELAHSHIALAGHFLKFA